MTFLASGIPYQPLLLNSKFKCIEIPPLNKSTNKLGSGIYFPFHAGNAVDACRPIPFKLKIGPPSVTLPSFSEQNVADPAALTKQLFNSVNTPRWKLCRRSIGTQNEHLQWPAKWHHSYRPKRVGFTRRWNITQNRQPFIIPAWPTRLYGFAYVPWILFVVFHYFSQLVGCLLDSVWSHRLYCQKAWQSAKNQVQR